MDVVHGVDVLVGGGFGVLVGGVLVGGVLVGGVLVGGVLVGGVLVGGGVGVVDGGTDEVDVGGGPDEHKTVAFCRATFVCA